jgi:SAM-dependent methyltransferase
MRRGPHGTDSTIDQDGTPKEAPPLNEPVLPPSGLALPAFRAVDLPTTEAIAAQLAPRDPSPPFDSFTIRQWLWGRGFHIPGHARHVVELVRPLTLGPGMSMLDAAAGLGGAARAIAEEFGVTVSALEGDPWLVRRGQEISAASGKRKRSPVRVLDAESAELRMGTFDRVLVREATHRVPEKERFLRVLALALKAEGQLLLTDFVVEPSLVERPELAAWAELQPHRPTLWTLRQYTDCLRDLGLELRVPEDMTDAYKGQILAGWDNMLRTVDLRSLQRPQRAVLVDELERWTRTVAVLDSGALKVYAFHALAGMPARR